MEERSAILVFGITGKIGSGTSFVADQLRHTLHIYKYEVEILKISTLIQLLGGGEIGDQLTAENLHQLETRFRERYPTASERTQKLQDWGNKWRNRDTAALVVAAVSRFIAPKLNTQGLSKRLAFILDSLKHPDEADYLRYVFSGSFFTIGVMCNNELRFERLRERKGYDRQGFDLMSQKDSAEEIPYGQQAIDTIMRSDYIVRNEFSTPDEIRSETERLVDLIFGSTIITPRKDEFGMSLAFQAAKQSACLSRQIGAAILNSKGEVMATGCNDAPKFGGGLYDTMSDKDMRCWARGGKCYNNAEQAEIASQILTALKKADLLKNTEQDTLDKVIETIQKTRLKQLIEYCRAVHAEMAAIVGIARTGVSGLIGSTLYTTTYPCHYCAKHIISAGINRVVYYEPYEKSLAVKLHSDAVNDSSQAQHDKVTFEAYVGVAPDQYDQFFGIHRERKESGKYVDRGKKRQREIPLFAPYKDELQDKIKKIEKEYQRIFKTEAEV
ncbi:MAG: anti-phage dCTP deaminase [Pseudomonadota bacterium]